MQFVVVIQALLYAGKQLQQLHIEEEDGDQDLRVKTLHSELLRKLILTASSFSVIENAAKLLSTLNKEAAEQGDLSNLLITSNGQFPEVCLMSCTTDSNHFLVTLCCLSFICFMPCWYNSCL